MEAHSGTAVRRRWHPAAVLLLAAGACLLVAACSGTSNGASSGAGARNGAAAVPGAIAKGSAARGPAPAGAGTGSRLTTLAPGGHDIVFTARLTVRARDTGAAASRAAQLAASAGGYVSSETSTTATRPGGGSVSVTLKVPAKAYRVTLAALSRLGKQLSASQRAQDVTQTVADVSSRVASAKAAISQLRHLLARAGTVNSLLDVQNEISQQETALESLQAQQRALGRSVSYATISLVLVSSPAPVRQHTGRTGGFTGGLTAGWHALRVVVSGLLTAAGAVLPFAVALAAIAALGWLGWRRYGRRRITAGRAPTPGAPGP